METPTEHPIRGVSGESETSSHLLVLQQQEHHQRHTVESPFGKDGESNALDRERPHVHEIDALETVRVGQVSKHKEEEWQTAPFDIDAWDKENIGEVHQEISSVDVVRDMGEVVASTDGVERRSDFQVEP